MTPIMRQILLSGKKNYIGIRHTAGTFNFGITNGADVLWVFPDGTSSTAAQPNVAVPAGVTKLYASNLSASGVQLTDGNSDAIVTSQLRDFNKLTHSLDLTSCTNVTGSLADLQGKLTYFLSLYNCRNITGSLADLQGKLTGSLTLDNCANVTGSLADLQGKLTSTLNLNKCASITGVYTPVGAGTPSTTILSNTGLSSADIDNTLIAYAAATKNNGTFTATGMTRTAASDAAVATLGTRGWTILGITKV